VTAAALAAAVALASPVRVDAIRIEGLVRTKPYVVRRELGFAEGDTITQAQLDLAVTRLWNTTIFAQVEAHVEGHVVVVTLEDRFTLNPLFRFASGGSAFYFRLGAADNNILGHFIEAQAQYEYFDGFHGGQVLVRNPRLFNRRLEGTMQLDRLTRPRPGFSDQRTMARLEVLALALTDRLRYGLRVDAFADRFLPPLDPPEAFPVPTDSLLFQPSLRIGRVDTVRLRQSGASLEVRPGLGFTSSNDGTSPASPERGRNLMAATYGEMSGEALGFVMLGSRWNLAVRARAATMTEVPAHLQLYVGGLDLLRGYPDNYVRTNVYALYNLEMRYVAFDSTWIALMPVIFTDGAAAREPTGTAQVYGSVGAGLRLLIPKFVGTGLRFDLAFPFRDDPSPSPSIGVYQFF